MPDARTSRRGVYCDPSCHEIKPKYAMPKLEKKKAAKPKQTEAAVHLK